MKKPVLIILAIFAGFVLLCCGGSAILFPTLIQKGTAQARSAESFGEAVMVAMCASWDPGTVAQFATPDFADTLRAPATADVFKSFKSTYGAFRTGRSQITGIDANTSSERGSVLRMTFTDHVTFEQGSADVVLRLTKPSGGDWQVEGLRVGDVSLGATH